MNAEEFRENQGVSIPEWNNIIDKMLESYHKSKVENYINLLKEAKKHYVFNTDYHSGQPNASVSEIIEFWDKVTELLKQ